MTADDGASVSENVEQFTCQVVSDVPVKQAIQISHNGITAWIPRSLIEYRRSDAKGHTVLRIPTWLYRKKFEGEVSE